MTMLSDFDWTPPLGRLVVRICLAPWQHEIAFCFARRGPGDGDRYHRNIARIRNWRGEPDFGGEVDCARGDFDTTTAVCVIVRRLATEDDVEALVKLWVADKNPKASRYTISEWLERVQESELCDEDKAMIARVVQEQSSA